MGAGDWPKLDSDSAPASQRIERYRDKLLLRRFVDKLP